MRVVHAVWSGGRLHLWGEQSPAQAPAAKPVQGDAGSSVHPFALDQNGILALVAARASAVESDQLTLSLPTLLDEPCPSPHLAHAVGLPAHCHGAELRRDAASA